ncbi:hypothetical protein C8J55DRAFT_376515, partial [Lentinula edodes]
IFESEEAQILQNSIQTMILDIRALYNQRIESSHLGRPEVVFTEITGRPGRPRTIIDPNFLQFAYRHRSTSGISSFLDVSRSTLRRRLLEYGIASPGADPFPSTVFLCYLSIYLYLRAMMTPLPGLIRWGIIIHGFIDGYSRLITGLRASNNNRGQTVLSLFISA